MANYYLAAFALRALSTHPALSSAYRKLGNRKTTRPIVTEYTRWVWEQAAADKALDAGKCVLELGTGWTHANSLYVGLAGNCAIMTFDVVDSRSLPSLKFQVPQVLKVIEESSSHSAGDKNTARKRAAEILQAPDMESVYRILRMKYQMNPAGVPDFPNESFDMIYSMDVLEHVWRDDFSMLVRRWRDMLKPGARFVAQVGLDDHLRHYDSSKSLKQYLKHSDDLWRKLLQNNLQYINRLTATEILDAFREAGMKIESSERELCDLSGLTIHPDYRKQSKEDRETVRLTFTARRPA